MTEPAIMEALRQNGDITGVVGHWQHSPRGSGRDVLIHPVQPSDDPEVLNDVLTDIGRVTGAKDIDYCHMQLDELGRQAPKLVLGRLCYEGESSVLTISLFPAANHLLNAIQGRNPAFIPHEELVQNESIDISQHLGSTSLTPLVI